MRSTPWVAARSRWWPRSTGPRSRAGSRSRCCATCGSPPSRATFGYPELPIGIPPSYAAARAAVSPGVARDLCLTGRVVDAAEALRLGIVIEVCAPDELQEAALAKGRGDRAHAAGRDPGDEAPDPARRRAHLGRAVRRGGARSSGRRCSTASPSRRRSATGERARPPRRRARPAPSVVQHAVEAAPGERRAPFAASATRPSGAAASRAAMSTCATSPPVDLEARLHLEQRRVRAHGDTAPASVAHLFVDAVEVRHASARRAAA